MPEGRRGRLVALQANPRALRSYNRDIKTLFGGSISSIEEVRRLVGGNIVVMLGFGNPALASLIEEWGGAGLIAVNPGVDIHWGTCTTIWGTPDLAGSAAQAAHPGRRREQSGRAKNALRSRATAATRPSAPRCWKAGSCRRCRWSTMPGAEEPEKYVLVHGHYDSWDVGVGDNATGDATLLEMARVLWTHRDRLRRSVKLAWWPGHSTGRYAGSTWFTDAFALDLDRNCLAQINCDSPGCRWATSYHETRSFMRKRGTWRRRDPRHRARCGDRNAMRPPQAGDYSFNNIGLPSFFMLCSTMPNALREEKDYYDVSGCGGNIAWHTENDTLEIADRDILLKDMQHLPALGAAHRQCRDPAVRLGGDVR